MPPTPVRVLVVDDQQPFRVAASAVLRRMPDFTLVGEAETGEDGVRAAAPRPRAHGRAPARHRRRRRGGAGPPPDAHAHRRGLLPLPPRGSLPPAPPPPGGRGPFQRGGPPGPAPRTP